MKQKQLKLVIALSVLLFTAPAFSQETAPSADEYKAEHGPRYSVGGGSYFGEETETFDGDALFLAAQWHGFDVPNGTQSLDTSSGIALEIGKSSRRSNESSVRPSSGRRPQLSQRATDEVVIRVWSINRVKKGKLIGGFDMKLIDEGGFDFDKRVVAGYQLHRNVVFEVYSLEEDRPIAWSFMYSF